MLLILKIIIKLLKMDSIKLILIRIIIITDKKQHKRLMKYMEIKSWQNMSDVLSY